MVGLDQQSALKQLINEVPSHVVLVNNTVGAMMHLKVCFLLTHIISNLMLFQMVSFSGGNRQIVRSNMPRPYGVSIFGDDMYWVDQNLKKVYFVSSLNALIAYRMSYLPLRILAMYEAKTAKINNFWTFWPVIHLIVHLLTSICTSFCPTVLRCKKCSDISEVTSDGRAAVFNCQYSFYIYGPIFKKELHTDFGKIN